MATGCLLLHKRKILRHNALSVSKVACMMYSSDRRCTQNHRQVLHFELESADLHCVKTSIMLGLADGFARNFKWRK